MLKDEKLLKICHLYMFENGHLAVPRFYVYLGELDSRGKGFELGEELARIKQALQGKEKLTYSKETIEKLMKLDPRVFEYNYSTNLRRELREEKVLKLCKKYFAEHGNLAIEFEEIVEDAFGNDFRLGYEMDTIKKYVKGTVDDYIFDKEFLDELVKIDPRVFEDQYSRNLKREAKEKKILKYFQQYYKIYENLAIPARYVHTDFETGEKYNLGKEVCCIKEYLKGVGQRKYGKEFLDKLTAMDPRVFEKDYPRILRKEMQEKEKRMEREKRM